MKAITNEMVETAATEHAKEILGNQFAKNKEAAKSIASDFKIGAKFILDLVTNGNEEIVNLTDYGK